MTQILPDQMSEKIKELICSIYWDENPSAEEVRRRTREAYDMLNNAPWDLCYFLTL